MGEKILLQTGKRETGERPVRSRHCETGAKDQKVTDFFISLEIGKAVFCVGNDGTDGFLKQLSQETCRMLVQERFSRSRGIDRTDLSAASDIQTGKMLGYMYKRDNIRMRKAMRTGF